MRTIAGFMLVLSTGIVMLAAADQTPSRRPAPASTTALEQAIWQQVNAYRARHQLPPLRWEERVAQQARQHSHAMLSQSTPLGHAGFAHRLAALQRVLPWSAAAENVAYSHGERDPATHAVQGWISSAGHRRNLLGAFTLTGIGAARNVQGEVAFTQIFLQLR